MRVSVQTTAGLERRMQVQVPAARVDQEVQTRLRELGGRVRLQGFRPGKVPPAVVRQRFGSQVHQEVVEELVKRSFAEAVVEQKLVPAGGPRIEPVSTLPGQDLTYTAVFEVYPEIKLGGLDGLEVERPVVELTDADVDEMLEHLRRQQPNWVPAGRAAQAGDRVTVDFEGCIDGAPFEGGKGENLPIVLGSGRVLPDLDQGLVGVSAGEEKTVDVRFPDDYQASKLAGKSAEFAVKVRQVDAPELPAVDEDFARAFGVSEGGVEALRSQVAASMRREVEQGVRTALRKQVLDALLAANRVELPVALVNAQVNDMQVDWGRRAGVYEVSKIPPREAFEETARRRVALGLLIGEVVRAQELKPDPQQVEAQLQAVVSAAHDAHAHSHQDAREHQQHLHEMMQAYRRDAQAMRQVESMVLEEQAVEWLIHHAKPVERKMSFREFTRFGEER